VWDAEGAQCAAEDHHDADPHRRVPAVHEALGVLGVAVCHEHGAEYGDAERAADLPDGGVGAGRLPACSLATEPRTTAAVGAKTKPMPMPATTIGPIRAE
jgi:hypothetical protein